MSRFDYVPFSEPLATTHKVVKEACEALEGEIQLIPECRERSLALTKLDECFMWCGRAIRDLTTAPE